MIIRKCNVYNIERQNDKYSILHLLGVEKEVVIESRGMLEKIGGDGGLWTRVRRNAVGRAKGKEALIEQGP